MGQGLCLAGAALGGVGLLGWIADLPSLTQVLPGQPPIPPRTGLALLLAGIAGALRHRERARGVRRTLAVLAAAVVLCLGAGTLLEYGLDLDFLNFGLGGWFAMRPLPAAALALVLLAAAILIFDARLTARARPSEWLLVSTVFLVFTVVLGQIFGASQLYRVAPVPVFSIAVPAALGLTVTAIGLLLERPGAGLVRIAASPGPGGILLRRLALAAVLVSVVLGFVLARLHLVVGVGAFPLVVAAVAAALTATSLILLAVTAMSLDHLHDVRERSEEALRLSEAKSSGILSISADAIVSIDVHHRIALFNEGAERVFGYAKAEVMGAALELLIPERFRAGHRRHVEAFLASPDAARRMDGRSKVLWGLRKDGEEFPADAAISKLEVGGTQILTVALRDITEQKRIEREQRFLAELGSVLISSLALDDTLSGVARLVVRDLADLCIIDVSSAEGDHRRRTVAVRDSSLSWAGDLLARASPDRRPVDRGWPGPDAKRPILLEDLPAELIASLALDEDQVRALRAVDPRSVVAVPLAAHDELLGVIILGSSSARAYGPAEVGLAEKLGHRAALSIENARLYRIARRAIEVRDDVLGIVAHDLRNPLGAILMRARLLQRGRPEPDLQCADAIERAANRMDRLIQDLLQVTCIEAGHLSVARDRLSPARTVAEAVEAQRPLAAAASLDLRLEVAPDLPEDVWADRDRLAQVFENLLGNAIKFTSPGGRIVAGAAPRDSEVLFWVTNSGAGIAAEDLPHLFDRFWKTRVAGRHGAGLGLFIAKGIVEAHGGQIWAESTQEHGTTFSFTLPTAPPTASPPPDSLAPGRQ